MALSRPRRTHEMCLLVLRSLQGGLFKSYQNVPNIDRPVGFSEVKSVWDGVYGRLAIVNMMVVRGREKYSSVS